jgi:hypothetical protein
MMVKIATEKSKGQTTATVPVHRDFAISLAAARNAGILGTGEVFTGKLVKGEIMPMNKKAWAAKFKKFARLARVTSPRRIAMVYARRAPKWRPIRSARKRR